MKVDSVYAEYNVMAESAYYGKKALIIRVLYKKGDDLKFNAIGDTFDGVFLEQTKQRIGQNYAK